MMFPPRSLKHEYELYVAREIEDYKESLPRSVLLGLGDEAVAALAAQQQLALTEILLCDEVDRIIRSRLRLPLYATWRRRRLRALRDYCRPERWGLRPDGALARAATSVGEGHALVAEADAEGTALYLAAHGCAVTALDTSGDIVERVLDAAVEAGLAGSIRTLTCDLGNWTPDLPLNAVVCSASALASLTPVDREHAIVRLQDATPPGGIHLLETRARGERLIRLDELERRYRGWQISVEAETAARETFLARKQLA